MLDCREKWFEALYLAPFQTFVENPTFRSNLASHIRKMRRSDITQWPPLALLATYPVAIQLLRERSSWLVSVFQFHCRWFELTR